MVRPGKVRKIKNLLLLPGFETRTFKPVANIILIVLSQWAPLTASTNFTNITNINQNLFWLSNLKIAEKKSALLFKILISPPIFQPLGSAPRSSRATPPHPHFPPLTLATPLFVGPL